MENIRTILLPLPTTIGGYTILKDDFYTIVLNSNLSFEQNMESYNHELQHIKNRDFYKRSSADLIEVFAHN